MTNPRVSCGSTIVDGFESAGTQFSMMISDQQGLCARKKPGFTCGGSLIDGF